MMNVVLYQPQIPPNTGNIARLCVGTTSELHLIRPLGFATDDATLKRAGLDYWRHLAISYHDSWEEFMSRYGQERIHFFSKKAERAYTRIAFQEGDFLVFGSETQGFPEAFHENYRDRLWTIPMWGPTRSLNLSTSVGIVLYEALRQVRGL